MSLRLLTYEPKSILPSIGKMLLVIAAITLIRYVVEPTDDDTPARPNFLIFMADDQ